MEDRRWKMEDGKRLHTEVGKLVGRISLGKKMNLYIFNLGYLLYIQMDLLSRKFDLRV